MYSGLEGVAVARTEWLYGCARFLVEPDLDKDGNVREGVWFDEQRIEIVEKEEPRVSVKSTARTGGAQRDPSASRMGA